MQKVIAIDFDGCLCTNRYPEVGEPNWDVINRAKEEQANGAVLILWTCRVGKELHKAIHATKSWGLEFDTVNDSLPSWKEKWGTNPRKIGATEYWDDKAVRMPSQITDGIVRCKNCEEFINSDPSGIEYGRCKRLESINCHDFVTHVDDFCSYGKAVKNNEAN